jgi:divalent metal cation (Fe/Co/Zn/Cd) transporter
VEVRDLNLWHEAGRERGEVEISPDPSLDEDSYPEISDDVRAAVQRRYPQLDLDVHIKVDFSASQLSDAVPTA